MTTTAPWLGINPAECLKDSDTRHAIRNVIRQLRPLRSATIAINAATQTFAPQVPPAQQAILDAFKNHALSD